MSSTMDANKTIAITLERNSVVQPFATEVDFDLVLHRRS